MLFLLDARIFDCPVEIKARLIGTLALQAAEGVDRNIGHKEIDHDHHTEKGNQDE